MKMATFQKAKLVSDSKLLKKRSPEKAIVNEL
jgi:hypothetical protein